MQGWGDGMVNAVVSPPLAALQSHFAIIRLGGELRVIDLEQIQQVMSGTIIDEPAFYRKADAEIMMKRVLEGLPFQSNAQQVVKDFWASGSTRFYNATAFTPAQVPTTTLNFWVGPMKEAKAGNWRVLRDFLRDVICAADPEVYEYLIRYMANMIQRPEEKPGVMLVLLGGQGTGKGMFFQMLRAIWSRSTLMVSDIEQVTGRFNASLERHFIVCMDEALFAGDRRSMDRLKSLVTESILHVEQKHQPSRNIESIHRFFASSNHNHFGNVELDDRRFVFLRVSVKRQQDTAYFADIARAINYPATIGAMVYYLRRRDLTSFDVRKKPDTTEYIRQKLRSLQGFDRFWYEVLTTGDLYGTGIGSISSLGSCPDMWSGPKFVPTTDLTRRYKEFDKTAQKHQTVQIGEVVVRVRKLCPSASTDRQISKIPGAMAGTQRRGIQLPALATARTEFEAVIGGSVAWE
jgi:hypothetical protein